MTEKGATKFDKMCHKIYEAKGNGEAYYARGIRIHCEHCGCELEVYYCEDRLYVVKCRECGTITLIKAHSSIDAAYRARARSLEIVDEMDCEEPAMFWSSCPPVDMPDYVGTLKDSDFPEGMKVGVYLPIPGTDGEELLDRIVKIEKENKEDGGSEDRKDC